MKIITDIHLCNRQANFQNTRYRKYTSDNRQHTKY